MTQDQFNPRDSTVAIDYTNHENKRRMRIVNPISLHFAANSWHKEPQWLLSAVDVESGFMRTFALSNIHSWRKATPHDLV